MFEIHGTTQIARFMCPICGPPGSWLPQLGPMLAPWILLWGEGLLSLQNSTAKTEGLVATGARTGVRSIPFFFNSIPIPIPIQFFSIHISIQIHQHQISFNPNSNSKNFNSNSSSRHFKFTINSNNDLSMSSSKLITITIMMTRCMNIKKIPKINTISLISL